MSSRVPSSAPKLRIDIGILTPSEWPRERSACVTESIDALQQKLQQAFPEFDWQVKTATFARPSRAPSEGGRGKLAIELLEEGAGYLEKEYLDFAVVIVNEVVFDARNTPTDVVSSQLLACGVVSINSKESASDDSSSHDLKSLLVRRLFLTVARLSNVPLKEEDLTLSKNELPGELLTEWRKALQSVADERLEESPNRRSRLSFYLISTIVNMRDVVSSVSRTRPWLFPFRLSKVTAGAVSTALIVLLTAESWELANAQAPLRGILAATGIVLGTIVYLLHQQSLLARVHRFRLSERRVIAEVTTVLAVTFGMLSTFVVLFAGSALVGWLLFPPSVVAAWTAGAEGPAAYAKTALLSATIGVTVGALGASLEAPSYLRFVISVDSDFPD